MALFSEMMDEAGELRDEIVRLRKGIKAIQDYLEEAEPRIGDATFACEALLAVPNGDQ